MLRYLFKQKYGKWTTVLAVCDAETGGQFAKSAANHTLMHGSLPSLCEQGYPLPDNVLVVSSIFPVFNFGGGPKLVLLE
jgi:hypothetical protein